MPFPTKNIQGLGAPRRHTHVPDSPPATALPSREQLGWECALNEHRENETSSLSSAGFWRLLAANIVPPTLCSSFRGGMCVEQVAPASSNEKQEQEKVALWRETSTCEDR